MPLVVWYFYDISAVPLQAVVAHKLLLFQGVEMELLKDYLEGFRRSI